MKNYGSPPRCTPPLVNSIVEEELDIKVPSSHAIINLQNWGTSVLELMDDHGSGSMMREHYFERTDIVVFNDCKTRF